MKKYTELTSGAKQTHGEITRILVNVLLRIDPEQPTQSQDTTSNQKTSNQGVHHDHKIS